MNKPAAAQAALVVAAIITIKVGIAYALKGRFS